MQQAGFTDKTSELTKVKVQDNIAQWSEELDTAKSKLAFTEENLENLKEAAAKGGQTTEDLFERFAAGGDEARAATDEVLTALFAMDDKVAQDAAGVALFGTMWEDLGVEGIKALTSVNGEISTTDAALSKINEQKYDDVGSAIEGVGRILSTSVSGVIEEDVLPSINDFVTGFDWEGFGQTAGEAIGVIVDALFAVANGAQSAVQWMNEHKGVVIALTAVVGVLATAITAYNVVQGIKTAMDAANVTTVWALVSAHIAQAAAAMAAIAPYVLIVAAIAAVIAIIVLCVKYWDEIVAAVKRCWDSVMETLSQWGTWINKNVIQPIVGFFSGLWDGIVSIFKSIGGWFGEKFTEAKNKATQAWSNAKAKFGEVWSNVKNAFSNVGSWFSEKFTEGKNKAKNAWSNAKSDFSAKWNDVKGAFSNVGSWFSTKFTEGKDNAVNAFNGIKARFTSIKNNVVSAFSDIKTKLAEPFNKARDTIKGVADKIKGFFKGNIEMPKIKLPHFGISPSGWKIGDLLKGSIPKLKIDWYADGGILTKPTVFGVNGNSLMAGGEAGHEAILPIDRLQGYIANVIDKHVQSVDMTPFVEAIEDLANRPVEMSINGRRFASATASDTDNVSGIRNRFKTRGLAID